MNPGRPGPSRTRSSRVDAHDCPNGDMSTRTCQPGQSTATSSAAQTCRIRSSLSRPRRSTSTATETLSTESRLTPDCRGTGSSPGCSSTSLANPRIVVVHGATRARRNLGIAASRERTTTGRLPTSGSSHHHTSPRAGRGLTMSRQPRGMTPDRPTHRPHRAGGHRRQRKSARH